MRSRRSEVTWVTFTSSSTAKNFITLLGDDYKAKLASVKLASIGPITTATLREFGLKPTVEATTFNIAGLIAAIAGALMHKWLARLAFSFLILAAVLAWSGREAAKRGDSATGCYATAAALGAAGIIGLRERHRRDR